MNIHRRRAIIDRAAICEPLEARRMLAVFTGTTGNDTINIFASGSTTHVVINGSDQTTTDLAVTIGGGSGNDAFTVQSTRSGSSILVLGQNDNDSLVNPTLLDLDAVYPGSFTFDGGNGIDTLVADNGQDSTTAGVINIHLETIANQSCILLLYKNVESLDFWDSNGGNRIGFISMRDAGVTNLGIHGNGGNDTITNTHSVFPSDGNWATSIGTGGAFVDGGSGTDVLRLNDTLGFGGTYTVNSSTIALTSPSSNAGPLTYSSCESIDFLTSPNNETVVLRSKPAGTALSFDSNAGTDNYTVGDEDINNSGFQIGNTTLVGGAGNDSIRFDDDRGNDTGGGGEIYNFGVFAFDKGAVFSTNNPGFNYSSFESQTIDLADGIPTSFNANIVNLNALSGQMNSTTINGGTFRSNLIHVTQGSLGNLRGTLNLNMGDFSGSVDINDFDSTSGASYEVNQTAVRKLSTGQTINYTGGLVELTLNTSAGPDVIDVKGVPVGITTLTVNAGGSNDNLFLGGGNVDANILSPVTLNGGPGTDFAVISNGLDTVAESMTLNATSLIDGLTYAFTGVEGGLTVNLGPGGTNLTINGTSTQTNVNGGSGDDTFTVGGGDIDANFPATVGKGLFIQAAGGNNSLRLNDLNDTNVDLYVFQQAQGLDQFVKRDGANENFITWSGMSSVTLDASNAPAAGVSISTILVNSIGTPLRINGNGGPDAVQVADAASPVIVHTGLGDTDNLSVNSDLDAIPVTVVIDQSDDIENLSIFNGGTLRVTSGAVLAKTRFQVSPSLDINGVLDLAGGALLSRAGGPTPAQFRTQIIAGRNGGAWNGTNPAGAINSSLAASTPFSDGVGYGLGSQIAPTTIGPFSIATNDTLLRYTLDGDADLNQQVNLNDFNRVAANFGQTSRVWVDGDSTYDSNVNLADFNPLAANFGNSVGPDGFGQQPIGGGKEGDSLGDLLEELT